MRVFRTYVRERDHTSWLVDFASKGACIVQVTIRYCSTGEVPISDWIIAGLILVFLRAVRLLLQAIVFTPQGQNSRHQSHLIHFRSHRFRRACFGRGPVLDTK